MRVLYPLIYINEYLQIRGQSYSKRLDSILSCKGTQLYSCDIRLYFFLILELNSETTKQSFKTHHQILY